MDIKRYLHIIFKRVWILILIPFLIGGITAYVNYFVLKPVYVAQTSLYIVSKNTSSATSTAFLYNDLQLSGQLLYDYTELIKSINIRQAVIEDLKKQGVSGLDVGVLGKSISSSVQSGTRFLYITVKYPNPVIASQIANSVATVFADKAVDLLKIENVSIIDKATVPYLPVSPSRTRNTALGGFAGVFFAVGLIFLMEYLNNSIRTAEDVEQKLQLPVIGTIPTYTMPGGKEIDMLNVVDLYNHLKGPLEESYNELRTNIQFSALDRKLKTVCLTSFNSGDGKTTTAINLAVFSARSGKKVLLIDTDLRKPVFRSELQKPTSGLSGYLAGMADFSEVVRKSKQPNLSITACGPKPPNPTELLSSSRFPEFIANAEEEFDLVIFDTPPLGSVIDAAIISTFTDGVFIIVEANSTDPRKIQKIHHQLIKAKTNFVAVILNKIKPSDYKSMYANNYYTNEKGRNKKIRSIMKVADKLLNK